jgi:hypothetical protein
MLSSKQHRGDGSPRQRFYALHLVIVVALLAAAVCAVPGVANGGTSTGGGTAADDTATAAAKLCIVRKQSKRTGRLLTVYKTKLKKVKVGGKTVRKRVYVYRFVTKRVKVNGRSVKKRVRVRVPKKGACSKVKLCKLTRKNKRGKVVPVYLTRVVKKKVRRGGRVRTVKKRVFVYKVVKKKNGTKKKVKVRKYGKCPSKKKKSTSSGIPVRIDVVEGESYATIDFGAFQREIPLSGTLGGFIVGKGFKLGEDNQIELTRAHVALGTTGIFIDDVCHGKVTDSIRVDGASFTEIDRGSTGNTVNVRPDASVTGLLHMRVQTALQMRNDDQGCDSPYFTTGWTDFTVPLFIKGKISAGKQGLLTTINIGETVLDNLSACLAPGPATLPCDGFAIPFPGILTAHIKTIVKIGQT